MLPGESPANLTERELSDQIASIAARCYWYSAFVLLRNSGALLLTRRKPEGAPQPETRELRRWRSDSPGV